jgi:hypothetical protein
VPITLPDQVEAAAFASFLRAVYAQTPTSAEHLSLVSEFGGPRLTDGELEVAQLKLMTDEQFKDVTLVVDGAKVKAHKFLLMARSKYLRTMFTRFVT